MLESCLQERERRRLLDALGADWAGPARDPAGGQLTRYPAEVFGPLPTFGGG